MTAWFYLLIAGVLEIIWATALKYADGFSRPGPSALGIATAVASFVLLALALRSLPMGTAYAVWVGIGIAGVAIFGILAFGEPASPLRLACIGFILAGIVGLKLADG